MNGSCHFVYSLTVSSMVVMNLERISEVLPNIPHSPSMSTLIIIGGVLGGILPDMDNPKSSSYKITEPLSTIICKVGKRFGRGGKYHRGILHDPILYIVGLILSYLYFPPLLGVFLGGITHIYLDLFNPVGLPLFFGAIYISVADINSGSPNAAAFTYINSAMVAIIGIGIYCGFFIPITAY